MIAPKLASLAARGQPGSLLLGLVFVGALTAAGQAGAQTLPYQSRERATVGTGLGQVDPPHGVFFEPRIEAAVQYADNINLAETSEAEDNALGLELAPGFYASYVSDRFAGAADYSLIARAWDDSNYDDVGQKLDANGRWTAIPELLYIDGKATYGDTIIDSAQGLNYGGLGMFGQDNLAEQATASVAPTLDKRFRIFEFQATYSYGRVWYLDEGKSQTPATIGVLSNDDSVDQSANVRFGTAREDRKLNGGIFYAWNRSDFDRAVPYEYERAGLDASYLMTRSLSLVGDVGKESALDESTSAGGLDSDFWSAGLSWKPDARTSAEGRFGERFFGNSYSGMITHRARLVELTASYAEEPAVQSRSLAFGEFDPGTLPPGTDPGVDGGRLNAQPYVSKDARVSVVAKGARTTLSLYVFDTHRDYLRNAFGDEHGTGGALTGTRRMFANFTVDATAIYTDIQRDATTAVADPVFATHDYDTQFILRGNREFGPKLTASLEAGYLNRSGSSNYDGWWVGLRGRWIPTLR
jgi:hypothetical protein